MKPEELRDVDFGGEVAYRIVVQGAVAAQWRHRLAGLSIETRDRPDRQPITTLVGTVRDQAELRGILDILYGLHLPLLDLERIGAPAQAG